MSAVENMVPVFSVTELKVSKEFYLSRLSFSLDWESTSMCSVSRDGHSIILAESGKKQPSILWVGLKTEDLIHQAIDGGIKVLQEPRTDDFGLHAKFADPDDNILWLGIENKEHCRSN